MPATASRRRVARSSKRRTAKHPISRRKLDANRRNAARSTGPRTVEGKSRSSRNALAHGFFCRDVLLPGEDAAAFAAMRHAMIADLHPADTFQWMLAERIVVDTWRQKRLLAAERRLYATQAKRLTDPPAEEQRNLAHPDLPPEEADRLLRLLQESHGVFYPEHEEPEPPRPAPTPDELMHELLAHDDAALDRLQRYEQRLSLSIARSERMLRARQKYANETDDDREAREDREREIIASSAAPTPIAEEEANRRNEPTASDRTTGGSSVRSGDVDQKGTGEPPVVQNQRNEPTAINDSREGDDVKAWPERPCHAASVSPDDGPEGVICERESAAS